MKLAWVTDLHLNFAAVWQAEALCREISTSGADAVLVGGDTAEAGDLEKWLEFLGRRLPKPLFFVLGNHDFYGGALAEVRERMEFFVRSRDGFRWLSAEKAPVRLTAKTCLVGHDGFGDARHGDHANSTVQLNDFVLIRELAGLDKPALAKRLAEEGNRAGYHFRAILPGALDRYEHIVVLTHAPPFREACWYGGRISDDEWLPYFTCKAAGDALLEAMRARPDRRMTVLCGHTHGSGEAHPLPNLHVRTGGSRYGHPALQQPLVEVE